MTNAKNLYTNACKLSETMQDTLNASLCWSGTMQLANMFGYKQYPTDGSIASAVALANLGGNLPNNGLKPDLVTIHNMLYEAPVRGTDSTAVERLVATGMSKKEAAVAIKNVYASAVEKHASFLEFINSRKQQFVPMVEAIIANTTPCDFPELDEQSSARVFSKITVKVRARGQKLVEQIVSGEGGKDAEKELKALRELLAA